MKLRKVTASEHDPGKFCVEGIDGTFTEEIASRYQHMRDDMTLDVPKKHVGRDATDHHGEDHGRKFKFDPTPIDSVVRSKASKLSNEAKAKNKS